MAVMDEREQSKAAPLPSSSFQDPRAGAGYLVHVFPHMRRKIDVIIDVFETHEKGHLIENKQVVNE